MTRFTRISALLGVVALLAAAPVMAQPQPLTSDSYEDTGYAPEGYIPLPGENDLQTSDLVMDDSSAAADPAMMAVEDSMEQEAPVMDTDPVAACQNEGGSVERCLAARYERSQQELESAAIAARAALDVNDQNNLRGLTASNLSYAAFRDAECLRQEHEVDAQGGDAAMAAQACAIVMNEMRTAMLRNGRH